MSLARVLVVVGLAVGGYLLYTKYVAQNGLKTPGLSTLPSDVSQMSGIDAAQLANNVTQISNLGLDASKGVGSVVLSAIGNAGVSDAAIREFVNTHDYGAFTRDVLNQNAKQAAQAQPVFTSRDAAAAWARSHS